MMEMGLRIWLEPHSLVIHSHDEYRSYLTTLRNQFDRGRFMFDTFGDSMDRYSLANAMRTYRDLVKQDSIFLDRDDSIPLLKRCYWKLYSAYIRSAYLGGFYLGYHHNKLPAFVSNFSMMERKRAR